MKHFSYFYQQISNNYSIGESFRRWFENEYPYSDDPDGNNDVSWFYGMTILGDPTLIPNISLKPSKVYIDDDFNNSTFGWQYNYFDKIQDGINQVAENGTIYVCNGKYFAISVE